jgi:DNA-directed RNA polymerase subunit H (RpoH/RPB5)
MEKFRSKIEKIPAMQVTDPVCRYYDFPVGSIIEIRRPELYYRHVINSGAKSNYEKFFNK